MNSDELLRLKTYIEKNIDHIGPEHGRGHTKLERFDEKPPTGGEIRETLYFDHQGDWTYYFSVWCPKNIRAQFRFTKAPPEAIFHIDLATNNDQQESWDSNGKGVIQVDINTLWTRATDINISIHTNIPHLKAKARLNWSIM